MGKYFSIAELTKSETANKRKINNKPTKEVENCLNQLIDNILDPLREAYGQPIIVSSGYRCPELNKAVGGVKTSGHLYGYCADLQVKGDLRKFSNFVIEWMKEHQMKWDQIIWEKSGNVTWLHFCWIGKDGKQRMKNFDIIK